MWIEGVMAGSFHLYIEMFRYMGANVFSDRLRDGLRAAREGGLVAAVMHPATPLLRADEPRATQKADVMRDRSLGEPDRPLDVAGAEARLLARDEVATAHPARPQQLQDLQPRRIPERLESQRQIHCLRHTSINLDISNLVVKALRSPGLPF